MGLVAALSGGDRRSTSAADVVAEWIRDDPDLLDEAFTAARGPDPIVRTRAFDAIEKATRDQPEWLEPYRRRIVEDLVRIEQIDVRWHVAPLLARLNYDANELADVVEALEGWLDDSPSRIVRTASLQALHDLAVRYAPLRDRVEDRVVTALGSEIPAVAARARRLIRAGKLAAS